MPSDEDRAYLEAYLAKKAVKKKRVEEAPMSEEKSTLHISTPTDYQVVCVHDHLAAVCGRQFANFTF